MRYANLITYGTRLRNYGEDVQFFAIENLYKYMNIPYDEVVRITIDDLFSYDGTEYLVVPINWPFWGIYNKLSDKIIPVYLGIAALGDSIIESMKFKEFQPIGCRDQRTFEICQKNGIESYINGCMTLTLPKREKEGTKVYIVDICDELMNFIPKELKEDAIYKTHVFYNREVSEEESKAVYQEYRDCARLVISSRLHCIIPCIAYGVPVIYAPKNLSTRSNWLRSIIPIYDEDKFSVIDWNPKSVEIEELKQVMLKNAMNRMEETWNKYVLKCSLSERFFDKENGKILPEDLRESIEYLEKHWEKDQGCNFIIWGVTQTAESLCEHIKSKYKEAKLIGVIDVYRKVCFRGIETRGIELLDEIKDAVVFVAAESAHDMAVKTFREKQIREYVFCWKNHNYKMLDKK